MADPSQTSAHTANRTTPWRTAALACLLLSACHASPVGPGAGDAVPRAQWIDHMTTSLPAAFCGTGSYFLECFGLGETGCLEAALQVTKKCAEQLEGSIPESLQMPADGKKWGMIVGTCAGDAFESAQAAAKLPSEKCKDFSNWLPK